MPQGPPHELIDHLVRVIGRHVVVDLGSRCEALARAIERHRPADGHHVEFDRDEAQLLDGEPATRRPAVGHEAHGRSSPLRRVAVQRGLEGRRVPVVVLRRHDDDGLRIGDAGAQRLGRGGVGEVGRERVIREVDEIERDVRT